MSDDNKLKVLNVDDRSYKVEDLNGDTVAVVNEVGELDNILNRYQQQLASLNNDIRRFNIVREVTFGKLQELLADVPSTKLKEESATEEEVQEDKAD